MSKVQIVELSPVVYCGGAGGAGEYPSSEDPNRALTHIVDVPVPDGYEILEAWWSPLHNIGDLSRFALIDTRKHNRTQLLLDVAASRGSVGRIRLRITVLLVPST